MGETADLSAVRDILAKLWPEPHRIRWERRFRRTKGLTYVCLPRPTSPTLLVPTKPARVTAAVLRHYKSPSTWTGQARAHGLGLAGRLGVLRCVPWALAISTHAEYPSLVGYLSGSLGDELVAGIALGPPRANRKPVLQLLTERGATIAYTKVGINDLTRSRISVETRALQLLGEREVMGVTVPQIVETGSWNGCDFLTTAPVDTRLTVRADSRLLSDAMQALVEAFPSSRASLVESGWWSRLKSRLHNLADSDGEELRAIADEVEASSGGCSLRWGATHGDWSPWNLATTQRGVTVWDWERFDLDGPVGLDSLHHEFQANVRLRRQTSREALRAVAAHADALVEANGADPGVGSTVLAAYLLKLGEQHLSDRQDAAGARKGPLEEWLIPSLRAVVADLA